MISFAASRRKKKCRGCGTWYIKKYWVSRKQWKCSHYCSNVCRMEAAHEARRGKPAWNKGLKLANQSLEKNHNWKGDKASYSAIHHWLTRWYKKSGTCEQCREIKKTNWANMSGQYRRERTDWKELCYSCHYHLDRGRTYENKYEKSVKRKYRNVAKF